MRAEIATPKKDLQGRVEDGPVLSRRAPRFFISRRLGCGRLCRHFILHWQKKRSLDLMVLDGLVSTQSKYWTVQYSNTKWPFAAIADDFGVSRERCPSHGPQLSVGRELAFFRNRQSSRGMRDEEPYCTSG